MPTFLSLPGGTVRLKKAEWSQCALVCRTTSSTVASYCCLTSKLRFDLTATMQPSVWLHHQASQTHTKSSSVVAHCLFAEWQWHLNQFLWSITDWPPRVHYIHTCEQNFDISSFPWAVAVSSNWICSQVTKINFITRTQAKIFIFRTTANAATLYCCALYQCEWWKFP